MAQGDGSYCRVVRAVALTAALAVLVLVVVLAIQYKPPLYYASIVSVSGLGVDEWGRQPVQFGLNLGSSLGARCGGGGRASSGARPVQVAYHGVELAYGITGDWELCARSLELWSVPVVGFVMPPRSNVTGLPEGVVEGLAADARRGVQVFDVTFWIPSTTRDHGDHGKMLSCMARVVGDTSLTRACDVNLS